MAKAGRKRKVGIERERSGRAQRVYENPRRQVSEQPHRVVVPVNFREFPEAESEFGRLMLLKHITPAQHEAGKQYAMLAGQYRSAKGYPPVTAQAVDLTSMGGGHGRDIPGHVVKAISDRYDRAFESICGQKAQKAVAHHAVFDRKIDTFDGLQWLKCGLDNLIVYFGIDRELRLKH
jgi:hypothetical protein